MHQIFERSENWCKTAKTLTIKLQTKESHAFLVCLLGASASQVRYIDIPVLPVDEFPAKMLVEHVTVVHQVGRQWTLRSAQIPETANFLIWKATRRVNWHEVQWELLDGCGLFNITGACFSCFVIAQFSVLVQKMHICDHTFSDLLIARSSTVVWISDLN